MTKAEVSLDERNFIRIIFINNEQDRQENYPRAYINIYMIFSFNSIRQINWNKKNELA